MAALSCSTSSATSSSATFWTFLYRYDMLWTLFSSQAHDYQLVKFSSPGCQPVLTTNWQCSRRPWMNSQLKNQEILNFVVTTTCIVIIMIMSIFTIVAACRHYYVIILLLWLPWCMMIVIMKMLIMMAMMIIVAACITVYYYYPLYFIIIKCVFNVYSMHAYLSIYLFIYNVSFPIYIPFGTELPPYLCLLPPTPILENPVFLFSFTNISFIQHWLMCTNVYLCPVSGRWEREIMESNLAQISARRLWKIQPDQNLKSMLKSIIF